MCHCPAPWRVPTKQDFVNLDRALGGTGNYNDNAATLANRYRNDWGLRYGGWAVASDGSIGYQGKHVKYWSQSEKDANRGYGLQVAIAHRDLLLDPQGYSSKVLGFALRCVK